MRTEMAIVIADHAHRLLAKMTACKPQYAGIAALIFHLALSAQAHAGRYAQRQILGFSPDGRYFAFEQFGRLDNLTELSYAEISIIHRDDNRPVPGTPIRKILHDSSGGAFPKNLEIVRKAAAQAAQKLLHQLKIAPRGYHLASNPMTELVADPHHIQIELMPITGQTAPIAFTLDDYPLPQHAPGQICDEPVMGFSLTMEQAGEPPMTVFTDAEVPVDRGCVLNYAIADIFRLEETGPPYSYAALIRYERADIEGPDTRFLAIMWRLP